jgi:hypothetical protein
MLAKVVHSFSAPRRHGDASPAAGEAQYLNQF